MLTLLKDLRYSVRTLLKMPGFTIVALLVLALGIGANTAIFSVVNSVVLRPLPYPGADRLALIWETDLRNGIKREGPSSPNFLDWKEQSQSFEEMALLEVGTGTVTGEGEPEQVVGLRVTTNFLSMLGARAILGRGFTTAEGAGQARRRGGAVEDGVAGNADELIAVLGRQILQPVGPGRQLKHRARRVRVNRRLDVVAG